MAIKRKFDVESDDAAPSNAKQLKLIPFPNYLPDDDVAMSDAPPLFDTIPHPRFPSNASSYSSEGGYSPVDSSPSNSPVIGSPFYPAFDLYPLPFISSDGSVDTTSHNFSHDSPQPSSKMVGLLQPSSNFAHHGTGCSQIPKLRMACSSGPNGQRTMWSHCEQCGAISMVDSD